MVSAEATGKDPRRQAAGRLGAQRRWAGHAAAVVRLWDLSPDQRHLVNALIRAAREQGEGKAAGEAAPTADAEGQANDRTAS